MTNVTGFRGMIRGFIAMIAAPFAPLATTQAQAELTLCNRTSFRMEAAVGIEKRANVVTRGWYRLDPGQCRQVMDGPFDADMVYLYARTPPVYGAAPLSQSGDADFCIRNGDFEVPNARGCPSSQQAHFSAAKPSDSPKGPVVNLAEEADYDDAQARLAGIQRLLVIQGYDAYPIDGVQGTKTQAAITKFINDRKFPPDTRSGENFFDVLIEAARNPDWCRLLLVQRHQLCGDGLARHRVTLGWYRVVAGQCVRPDVRGDPYKLYSYAEAVDANGRAVKRGDTPIAWGGTVALCRDGRFELADHKDCAARGLNSAGFVVIDLVGKPSTTVRFKEP